MSWTNENPGDGDLGQMSSAATDLGTKRTTADTVAENVLSADQAVNADVWSGVSTDAWRGRLTTGRQKVVDLAGVFGTVSTAIDTYRSTVSSIKSAAEPWRQQLWDAERRANMSYVTSQDPTQEQLDQIRQNQTNAQRDVEEAQRQLGILAGQREDADSALVSAVNGALPGDWPAVYSALVAAGFTDMDQVGNTAAVQQMMTDLARGIGEGPVDPEDAAALTALMQLYGGDETIMSRHFDALGGDGTVDLINALGDWGANDPMNAAAAVALAALTRSGLSVGSRNWSERTAEDFTDGMFDNRLESGDEIGYLFADSANSPLGETLAIAAANAVDRLEREELFTWTNNDPFGGSWLAVQEFGDEGNRVLDASGPIFSTLGEYPNAAYEWLTADGLGDDRVQYWYHDRYEHLYWYENGREQPGYLTLDRFEGLSELWFGSQQADGGPMFPGVDGPANPEQAAILSSDIMQALVTNGDFTPDNISDRASAALAGGFVVHLPGLAQYPINGDLFGDITGGAQQLPDGTWVPVLSEDQLAVFMGRAGSSESGYEVMSWGVSSYQETLLNMAMSSSDPNDIQIALDRMLDLQAAFEGSMAGQEIQSGQDADAEREAIVSGITGVLGAIPIPGIGSLVGGGAEFVLNWGQGVALGHVTGGGSDAIAGWWADQADQAVSNFQSAQDGELADSARFTIASSVYEYFSAMDAANAGTDGYQPMLDGIPAPGDADSRNQWYAENGAALQERLGSWVQEDGSVFDYNYFDTVTQGFDDSVEAWAGRVDDWDGYVEWELYQ
ncbi:MAG TPA: hypothetical protein VN200_11280 [Rhodoglobus sp.]|nr:hypothetical protein [Rhodoglobus sp.]